MPEAVTTSEKLEMTEPITISNIEKKVREKNLRTFQISSKNANYDKMGTKLNWFWKICWRKLAEVFFKFFTKY